MAIDSIDQLFETIMVTETQGIHRSRETGNFYPMYLRNGEVYYYRKGGRQNKEYSFKSERGARKFLAEKIGGER